MQETQWVPRETVQASSASSNCSLRPGVEEPAQVRDRDHLTPVLGLGAHQAPSAFNSASPGLSTDIISSLFDSFTSLSNLPTGCPDFTD